MAYNDYNPNDEAELLDLVRQLNDVGDGQTFDEMYATLAAMQNPWRNATMHLDQKLPP